MAFKDVNFAQPTQSFYFPFFPERQNGFRGGVLGSFSIDLMDSQTIHFFSTPKFGDG